jgi:hypothetical protein
MMTLGLGGKSLRDCFLEMRGNLLVSDFRPVLLNEGERKYSACYRAAHVAPLHRNPNPDIRCNSISRHVFFLAAPHR